jgi:hypothetical protein
LGVGDTISENKMFLSIFFGLVWREREERERDFLWSSLVGREREKRERERDRMVQRVQRTATTSTHTYMHTLFQSCHLQRHVSKVRFPFSFIHSFMQVNDNL